jgi:hypothetical protein
VKQLPRGVQGSPVVAPIATLLIATLLLGCAAIEPVQPQPVRTPTGTESPPASPANGPPTAEVPDRPTDRPTGEPTPGQSPVGGPTSPPSSPGLPTDAPALTWQHLADFPSGDALVVSAAATTAQGFIAVGAEPAPGEGPDGLRQGVIWTSTDGTSWLRQVDPTFAGATLDSVVELDDAIYVLGFVSQCPAFDDECPALDQAGNAAWRGTPSGGWQRLVVPQAMAEAVIEGVIASDEQLIVRGSVGDDVQQTLWLSRDGNDWASTTDLAGMDYVSEVAAAHGSLIAAGIRYAFDSDMAETVVGHSTDGLSFEPATLPEGIAVAFTGLAAGPEGLVAIGNSVSGEEGTGTAVVLRSSDGRAWEGGLEPAFGGAFIEALHGNGERYLAIGSVPAPESWLFSARAWWSSDGRGWEPVGDLAGAGFSELTASASGAAGTVVFAVELSDERPVVVAWHAPAGISAGR